MAVRTPTNCHNCGYRLHEYYNKCPSCGVGIPWVQVPWPDVVSDGGKVSDNPKLFEWKAGTFYESEITLRDMLALAVIAAGQHALMDAYVLADRLLAERAKRQG